MLNTKFGIEIEFTGITRERAAKVAAEFLQGTYSEGGTYYDTKKVITRDGRVWKFMYDGSLRCQRKENGSKVSASRDYSVELVSPILSYREDIEILQELVRRLRRAGAFTNNTCGIHIHLNGSEHTPRSIRNFVNIIASKNDLFYKALQIAPQRMRYCKKMDSILVEKLKRRIWGSKGKVMWQCSTYINEGKDHCEGISISEELLNQAVIKGETVIKEEKKNGKKHYSYTSKGEYDKSSRKARTTKEKNGSLLPGVNGSSRTVIKL